MAYNDKRERDLDKIFTESLIKIDVLLLTMKRFESDSTQLIGTDPVDSINLEKFFQMYRDGTENEIDPTIVYQPPESVRYFIIEGNHRAYVAGKMQRKTNCVAVESIEDIRELQRQGVHVGKLVKYDSMEKLKADLIDHLGRIRPGVWEQYLRQDEYQSSGL